MVKVVKRDKSLEVFKSSKIVKACKGSGMPVEVAKTIALMVSKKVKGKPRITSMQLKKMIFAIIDKVTLSKKNWMKYKKKRK